MPAVPLHLHPLREKILADGQAMGAALLARSQRDGKHSGGLLDMESAVRVVQHLCEHDSIGEMRAVIAGDSHLFLYFVGPLWFNPHRQIMIEQFFMRVDRGPHSAALQDIEDLAREVGAQGVLMATMLAPDDEALGRLFARSGYQQQSTQHFKEIH